MRPWHRGARTLAVDVEYDALLIVGFGGPERREDVIPFLENVTRGRNVPRERLLAVAEHYDHFGGKSPLNDQVLRTDRGFGAGTPAAADRPADLLGKPQLAPVSGRHAAANGRFGRPPCAGVGAGGVQFLLELPPISGGHCPGSSRRRNGAPSVDKIRVFYNHPGFIAANAEHLLAALAEIPADRRDSAHVAFTAHSIPLSMAGNCRYEEQLREACRLVCERLSIPDSRYGLAYQSRSGRPARPVAGTRYRRPLEQPAVPGRARRRRARRSVFCPTTSKCCMTWMWKPGRRAASWASRWSAPRPSARIRRLWPSLADLIQERLTDAPDGSRPRWSQPRRVCRGLLSAAVGRRFCGNRTDPFPRHSPFLAIFWQWRKLHKRSPTGRQTS